MNHSISLFTWPFSSHRSIIRGNFIVSVLVVLALEEKMASGLNEDVCHEEPVESDSKAQSSIVSESSVTDSNTHLGLRTSACDIIKQEGIFL